uniref:NET domain-containing protein n=1 Tax=Lotharella oceanica TaxID=641309 RepID=A0A7S2TKG1_9EUKA|eukprot:CAMPEP_0170170908 /NCGR_PEP_ID=MMETSP0040_2-20121228/3959_1 /TAXON_ID=641309 /ORGANISM="Lotharella oceanica, Strain CCMP622" /LENGTH=139 /DNA_ID=CAMNT_0010410621 /DNA_START=15 /DNA_END=434 /DNA_ORIENTATION=+
MGYKAKQKLFQEIHHLPPEKLEGVVSIIASHDNTVKRGQSQQAEFQEVEIDIAALSDDCLKELKRFVSACTAKQGEPVPEVGMRVSVWFTDPPDWYAGTITRCRKVNGRKWKLHILYDDGEEEDAVYPDPKGELMLRRH